MTTPKTPRLRPILSAEELARFNRNAPANTPQEDLEIDPASGLPRWYVGGAVNTTWSPFDFIGGPVSAQSRLATGEATHIGRIYGRQFLARETGKLTDHGTIRVGQRLNSADDINDAVQSAIKTGKITKKIGKKYKTPQFHYEGDSGLIVIIETQGRNAGKVITTYGKNPEGKI